VRVGELVPQLVGAFEDPGEAEELVLHLAEVALGPGDGEERVCVDLDALGRHQRAAPTRLM
jgi:hypothetical protein